MGQGCVLAVCISMGCREVVGKASGAELGVVLDTDVDRWGARVC